MVAGAVTGTSSDKVDTIIGAVAAAATAAAAAPAAATDTTPIADVITVISTVTEFARENRENQFLFFLLSDVTQDRGKEASRNVKHAGTLSTASKDPINRKIFRRDPTSGLKQIQQNDRSGFKLENGNDPVSVRSYKRS